jgi:hypothetical protein
MPSTAPATAPTMDSIDANRPICRRVAPTRRIAAYRSSRRAAAMRVALPISTIIGTSRAAVPSANPNW